MAGYKTQYTLRRYKADKLLCEYMTGDRFEDCYYYMMMMEDTERFEYYEIAEEKVYPDGTIETVATSQFSKSAENIGEIDF